MVGDRGAPAQGIQPYPTGGSLGRSLLAPLLKPLVLGHSRQWLAAVAQVRKGERGTTVVLWKQATSGTDDDHKDADDPGRRQKELGLSIGPKDPLLALWVSQKELLEQNAAQQHKLLSEFQAALGKSQTTWADHAKALAQQSLNAGLQAAQNTSNRRMPATESPCS